MRGSGSSALLELPDANHDRPRTPRRSDPARPGAGGAADRHIAAERGEDVLPIFPKRELDDRGGSNESQSEEQCSGDMSHSFFPYFIHRTILNRKGFIAPCFRLMFMFRSFVNA